MRRSIFTWGAILIALLGLTIGCSRVILATIRPYITGGVSITQDDDGNFHYQRGVTITKTDGFGGFPIAVINNDTLPLVNPEDLTNIGTTVEFGDTLRVYDDTTYTMTAILSEGNATASVAVPRFFSVYEPTEDDNLVLGEDLLISCLLYTSPSPRD